MGFFDLMMRGADEQHESNLRRAIRELECAKRLARGLVQPNIAPAQERTLASDVQSASKVLGIQIPEVQALEIVRTEREQIRQVLLESGKTSRHALTDVAAALCCTPDQLRDRIRKGLRAPGGDLPKWKVDDQGRYFEDTIQFRQKLQEAKGKLPK